MSEQIISREGYQKLVEELEMLSTERRREIADRIEKAKELGDLSENAEYSEAKEAQAFNEGKINELTGLLKNLVVVDGQTKGKIGMGSKIKIKNGDIVKEFTIVSFNEADPVNGFISNESPLGQAFLGHAAGDKVKVNTPKGETEYEIVGLA
ncbi:MAG TPA: transcription elongation factor GreA [bacterium]|nr:transcription elongation factor GreA [bacterium]